MRLLYILGGGNQVHRRGGHDNGDNRAGDNEFYRMLYSHVGIGKIYEKKMTLEQYNRAVEISKRLEELEKMSNLIANMNGRLVYIINDLTSFLHKDIISENSIFDILDRHDKMIREEIDAEIEKLKKEIEEL